ncbi:MAG TPA: cytochrome c, partial [Chitinophagales bacterium]|nr:cytochrome c [Chitinophagales bacterium]
MKPCIFTLLYLAISLSSAGQSISFTASNLAGESLYHPTALQFGPDGRLYVAQQDGKIFAYTIVRNAANSYAITATETITLIQQIPNHNDDGSLNPNVNTRQVTGILVAGTAANPVIYVSSSDPRIGGGSAGPANDKNLDTNSGVLSKLTKNGNGWIRTDLVRGLPRSEENHSTNGMQLDAVNNILYLNQGGNTNMGAPSNNFVYLPEYAYSASILKIDLNRIGNTTYDLPTLDDEDKPDVSSTAGYTDNTDPFGGNSGKNQAKLDPAGPVQIYSTGWRNHYDLVLTQSGRMYSFDNGPNYGWGGATPDCSNTAVDPGTFYCDVLHYIPGQGYYAGHPNPTRANRANTFNITHPQSPIPLGMENPAECQYIPAGSEAHALTTICSSTNGMCEYKASNFSNALNGDLLAAAFNGKIYRFKLNAAGDAIASGGQTVFASNFGSTPLDVTAQGDNDIFPGTVWAITYGSGDVTVFEPSDYSESNPALIAYNNANKVIGGKLYRKFWAEETGFVSPVDPTVDMNNVISFPQFYRCVSCHAYDFKGRYGSFIDSAATVHRPKVAFVNLHDSIPHMSITELFDAVKHAGGALVDPARTADGTNASLGGNRMPDYSKLLTDAQIWDIVKYLKEAYDTDDLYDITTSGTYPTGTKSFSNIGKDGNAALGLVFYNSTCRNCHAADGRSGELPRGMSLGEFVRKEPSEVQFRAVFGTNGVGTSTLDDVKNFLKALSDKNIFPDMHPIWYRDADADGYGIPNDTSMAFSKPQGYVADNTDCDDAHASVYPNAIE